jgi:hypothetical protein
MGVSTVARTQTALETICFPKPALFNFIISAIDSGTSHRKMVKVKD